MRTTADIRAVIYNSRHTDNPIAERFLSLQSCRFIPYSDEGEIPAIIDRLKGESSKSKEVVILREFQGRLVQMCPGSKNVICCNYRLLNTGFGCLYDCTYCYLNSYLNSFGIIQFTNIHDLSGLLEEYIAIEPAGSIMRIGTGEFTDSLMMDDITGTGVFFINRIAPHKNIFLELKTKSTHVASLLDIQEKGNTVLAWSLNTPANISLYEPGSAGLDERLGAASLASGAGYLTAFHFDPMILDGNYLDDYPAVVDMIFRCVDPERVAWISLGCFRYSPGFKENLRERAPFTRLAAGEMFPGQDGKFRYLKRLRIALYRAMKERIEFYTKTPFIYLCMEPSDVWKAFSGREYKNSGDLESDINRSLAENFLVKKNTLTPGPSPI